MNNTYFLESLEDRSTRIGIIGLGYVGLPLMLAFVRKGFRVYGFDTDPHKIAMLNEGISYIQHIDSSAIKAALEQKMFCVENGYTKTACCDVLIICVPTPLNKNREPDLQYVVSAASQITPAGKLVILESTTYPGTTDGILKQTLEQTGTKAGKDWHLAFSPEREDPGNKTYNTTNVPKIVGGYTKECGQQAYALYKTIVDYVVTVSTPRIAEMSKLLENIFRSVNIALVNELKMLCDAMDIDVWEVIEAASTKPFGFMQFQPGPGLGGHCIPIDPFYLTWKAREYGKQTRFIELAGEVNTSMHHFVTDKILYALNSQQKAVKRSAVLIVGVAYKKDIDDVRESPALPIMEMLLRLGAHVRFYDPFIKKLAPSHDYDLKATYPEQFNEYSVADVVGYDIAVIVTNHSGVDYQKIVDRTPLIVDCRNVTKDLKGIAGKVFKA